MSASPWDWLKDTYWYVPRDNLLAFVFKPELRLAVSVADQTVFHIRDSQSGYFWGDTVVQIVGQPRNCYFMSGSVTPAGTVLLAFTPTGNVTPETPVTHGTGIMTLLGSQAAMLNQMSSGPAPQQISHWAYMLQTVEGDASWDSLPGVSISVPEFLSSCFPDE